MCSVYLDKYLTHLGITVMFKQISIAGFALISLLLSTTTNARAELAPTANSLEIHRIDRSMPPQSHNQQQIASAGDRSMSYVKMGLAAEKQGDAAQALEYYYQAVKTDNTNAIAFLLAGNLLGETEDGIACIKAAGVLFQAQENQEGYELAMTWLKVHNVAD
jgi:tetratricopeptide (TPR) repeat protein